MHLNNIKTFFIAVLLLSWVSSQGQQHNFIKYSLQEGLPQSQVFTGMQDDFGYLWFGTQGGGISRFDGREFQNFTTKNGLPSNYINAIFQDEFGRIWIGSDQGICYFDGQNFLDIISQEEFNLRVNAIYSTRDSSILIGTERGIYSYSYSNKTLEKLKLQKRLDIIGINAFFKDNDGLWVATNEGLWNADDPDIQYTAAKGLKGDIVVSIASFTPGQLLLASYDGGLSILNKKRKLIEELKGSNKITKPIFIQENKGESFWIGTRDKGIFIYQTKDSSWTNIDESQGLNHNHVRKIFRDSWNNTWVCTSGGGIGKYIGQFFEHYNVSNGLHGNYVYALCNQEDGGIIVSASNNGIRNFNGSSFSRFATDSNYIDVKAKAILVDRHDNTWIGTEGKGLVKLDSNKQEIFTTENGLSSNWIKSLEEDNDGNIWMATNDKGLIKMQEIDSAEYEYHFYGLRNGLPDLYLSTLEKSPNGMVWFASKLGNIGFVNDDNRIENFGSKEGIPKVAIRTIAFDSNGSIWIGTAGRGVYYSKNQSEGKLDFKELEFPEGKDLFSDNVYSLLFDPQGNLWVGSEAGVDKVEMNEAKIVVDVHHFGRNNGFHGIETCQNSAIVDQEGNLWFGTMNGLMKHSIGQDYNMLSTPRIHFKDISLFYKPLSNTKYKDLINKDGSLKQNIEFPHDENHLSFEFKALNINDPKGIKYQWRLKGIEENWSPLSNKESVDYSNLSPGDYCFEVEAITGDKIRSGIINSCFRIKKPFWMMLWFQLLSVFGILLAMGIVFYNWKRKLELREAKKRDKLILENHVLQLEQKALQLQMNPHFIFNALNSIQSLVASNEQKDARVQIHNFAGLMRGVLSNSRKTKISLTEEIKVLEKYLELEKFCQNVSFEYQFDIASDLDPDEIEIPPMILQPFVENSVIHGVSHLQKEGEIKIIFALKEMPGSKHEGLLLCKILDNGIGREKAEKLKQSTKPGHQSVAMEVTRERLLALRLERKYEALTIRDLLSPEKKVIGTEVLVQIPINIPF